MICRVNLPFLALLGILPFSALAGDKKPDPAELPPLPRFETRLPPGELRASIIGLANSLNARRAGKNAVQESAADYAALVKLLGAYRLPAPNPKAPPAPHASSIIDGPYLGVIVGEVLKAYPDIFADAKEKNWEKEVTNVAYSTLFDAAIKIYVESKDAEEKAKKEKRPLPPPMPAFVKQAGDKIGDCLARRIYNEIKKIEETAGSANPEVCELDNSTKLDKPSLAELAALKFLGCPTHLSPGDCSIRRKIFNSAKEDLIKAQKLPEVQAEVGKAFNATVREQFLKTLNQGYVQFPQLLAKKFGGTLNPLLLKGAPLVERDGQPLSQTTVALHDLAQGIQADILAAEVLHRSADPLHRGLSAALTFAAANRILMMGGGDRAVTTEQGFVVDERVKYDPEHPSIAPAFKTMGFGGWGFGRWDAGKGGTVDLFSAWDLKNYKALDGGAIRLFPEVFLIDAVGTATPIPEATATENLSDIADLVTALGEFLRVTGPTGELAAHFVSQKELGAVLLDGDKPGIFPADGRELAFGLAAAALQNLAAPTLGHLEQVDLLTFHDRVTLDKRSTDTASVRAVGKALLAVERFRQLKNDPQMPPDIRPLLDSKVQTAVWAGELKMIGVVECDDGGFPATFDECRGVTSSPSLGTSVSALRSSMAGYVASREPVAAPRLAKAWNYLDGFWRGASAIPHEVRVGTGQSQPVNPSRLWTLMELWEESKGIVQTDLPEVNWALWKQRFDALGGLLDGQLRSTQGPEPVVD